MADTLQEKQSKAGKSALWYTAVTLFTKGLSFITIPIFTRIMTTGEFGLFNNFAAWETILLCIFSLESYATLNRARLDYEGRELQEYQFTLLTAAMGLTVLLAIVLVVAPAFPELLTGLDVKYLYVMVLYLMFYPAFTMFQMLQRVTYRYKLSAALGLGSSLLATVSAVALVIYMPDALMGRLVGQFVPLAVLGIGFYLWYWKTGGCFRVCYLKYAMRLCVPLIIATLGAQVLLLGCRIITQHMCGADEVGYLSLATSITQIVIILINALNNAWMPWLYDCLAAGQPRKAINTFRVYFTGLCVLVIVVCLVAPELVFLLGGATYAPSIDLVASFVETCLFSMLATQYIQLETYHKKAQIGGIATLVIGVINLGLCALVIQVFGFQFVGYANIVSNLALVLVHKLVVKRMGQEDLFSFKTIAPPLLVAFLMLPLSFVMYEDTFTIARYAIVLVLMVCAGYLGAKNRQKLLAVLKKKC